VLGATSAQLLGIDRIYRDERIWVGGQWFYLTGILRPAVLASDIDSAVLIGYPAAGKYLGFDGHPSTIYLRAQNERVNAVDDLLANTANPENPSGVNISQPSDALVAQADAKGAFDGLFLGLGAVALLVGAVGVANIMIISVLERRSEIGLRRALGATRGHIRTQFLSQPILLRPLGAVLRHGVAPTRGHLRAALDTLGSGWARAGRRQARRRAPQQPPGDPYPGRHRACGTRSCQCPHNPAGSAGRRTSGADRCRIRSAAWP